MEAFHSLWTKPRKDYGIEEYELLTLALSALKWREKNGNITLVTDTPGLEFFKASGFLPCWTKVAGFGAGGVLFWLGCTYVYIVYAYYLCGTYLLASEGVPPSTDDCDKLL